MWIHQWKGGIKGLDFSDLGLISKFTGNIRISNLDQKRFVCTLSRETIDEILLNSYGYTIRVAYLKKKKIPYLIKGRAFCNWWRRNILMTV